MQIIGKRLNKEEFSKYVEEKYFGAEPANKLVIHHTWKPSEYTWAGKTTIEALKRFYESKGWTAGPHLFIAPDGIWLFSDMRYDGIHAGEGNYRSVGIEVVGNYDGAKWSGDIKDYAFHAIWTLQEKLGAEIKFHRDYSKKSCPGWAITKEWIAEKLAEMDEAKNVNTTRPNLDIKNEPVSPPKEPEVSDTTEHPKTSPEPKIEASEEASNQIKDKNMEKIVPTKKWFESKTVRLAIAQGALGILVAILAEVPELKAVGAIAVFKSILDSWIRIEKTWTEIEK